MKKRMTRRAAIEKVVEVLDLVRDEIDLEALLAKAQEEVERRRALRAAYADWPRFNAEVAAGEVDGFEPGAAPLSWDEYLHWSAEHGEWDAERWGFPPEPSKD